jgi:hypothetical protein
MALNAQGYFNCLNSYLNLNHYGEPQPAQDAIVLKEKVFGQSGSRPIEYKINLKTNGEVIVLKLDRQKNGAAPPLFHFLDDTAKPWSKRCDFIVINRRKTQLFAYCLEFKSESIPQDVPSQLQASLDWLKSLHATVNAYTGKRSAMRVTKYVLSDHPNPAPYLDPDRKYLLRDHTVRHYRYSEIDGMPLTDLENTNVDYIR